MEVGSSSPAVRDVRDISLHTECGETSVYSAHTTNKRKRRMSRLRVLGQWFDGIRFYAAASSPRRSRRTWAGLR